MAKKDPAFLFYPSDWQLGTMTMSRHIKGCYMDLLVAQFSSGSLSLEEIRTVLGTDFSSAWNTLQKKFAQDATGKFFNERLEVEKAKRKEYSLKQKERIKKRWDKSGNTTVLPQEENVNENENRIGNENKGVQGDTLKIPTLAECEIFFQQCDRTRDEGEKFFHHYQAQGWKVANGLPITDWASLAQKWILNPKENKNGKIVDIGEQKRKFDENYARGKAAGNTGY